MKAIITGMNGTVAPVVASYFEKHDVEIIPWDRSVVPTDNEQAMYEFITRVKPDFLLHIGMGSPEMTEFVARICFQNNITFLFTSTVSVFSESGSGPYTVESEPNAEDDYGLYKRKCERLIKEVNKDAYIVRIGWQIGDQAGSNNMVDFLVNLVKEKGYIEASNKWYPSCSHLIDTAKTIYDILNTKDSGLYLVNSNQNRTFYDIVNGLNNSERNWNVKKGSNPSRDDRMFDDRIQIQSIATRLGIDHEVNE
ncbi:sugar nucleotide-binding protein [Haloplasma contractile]|uniref:dTDP-4-dehydrorhamnose reductase n=1 Tax=Haloplasma contractile SSD-17B TaxID=1033810 RepID=F7Q1W3_9MOLU|nr:sugar nucleotide-binding protein [Haloplasma contractile]ERJ12226.1 dTDP-4-dehydrorhamnose reductase protein [Haloplasma contractile SSD-17B]